MPRTLAPLLAVVALAAAGCGHAPYGPALRLAPASDVDAVVADHTGVYFIASGALLARHDGAVLHLDRDGVVHTVADDLDDPAHLALGAGHLWWLTEDGLYRAALAPGQVGAAAQVVALDHPTALTLLGADPIVAVDGALLRVSTDGSAATTLVADAGDVVDLASDGVSIYWADRAGGRIRRADLPAGANAAAPTVTTLAADQIAPVALAVAGGSVAWITAGETSIEAVATVATMPAGGGAVRVLHRGGYIYEDVALVDGWVYWTWGDLFSSAHRVRLTGGAVETVTDDQTDLDGLAIAGGVVWIGGPDGLYRVAPR